MNSIQSLADQLRTVLSADIFTDAEECEASVQEAYESIEKIGNRLSNVAAYHAELERLGLTANTFDYAAIIELLEGGDFVLPIDKDR